MNGITGEFKVYLDKLGQYYRSMTGPREAGDSLLPSPSPALHTLLEQAESKLGLTEVGHQEAWDVVGMASQQQSDTDKQSASAADPVRADVALPNNSQNLDNIVVGDITEEQTLSHEEVVHIPPAHITGSDSPNIVDTNSELTPNVIAKE